MMLSSKKKIICIAISALIVLIVGLALGRNAIVRFYVDRKLRTMEQRYNLTIRYRALTIQGLSTLHLEGLSVVPLHSDTLLSMQHIEVKLSFPRIMMLKPVVKYINGDDLAIHLMKDSIHSNYAFLFHVDSIINTPSQDKCNYEVQTRRILDLLFGLLPSDASFRNIQVTYLNQSDDLALLIPVFNVKKNRFITHIRSTENGQQSIWVCEGLLQDDERRIEARLYAKENSKITLPFINYRWHALMQFDTLLFNMAELKEHDHVQSLNGLARVSGLTLHHERISPDTVLLDSGSFAWKLNVGKNYLELDSSTEVIFNRMILHPYLKLQRGKDWHITMRVDKRDFPANDLFASFPPGLFSNLDGLKADGTLTWHFLLDVDFTQIDSLLFESTLKSRNFRIVKQGKTDLHKMNGPFMYTAYENGNPVRTFEVGPDNPSFRPIGYISRFLPIAIMQSEDAGFFQHSGFIPSAIRESLVKDLKERRFARGGSTLSMQLVKNVFLSKNKTIARKIEEILITWLIETNHLTSKERMFEVYMNIAEWGPLIYGACEASHYYFAKEPSELTLSECIFLASIIPKPKHVHWCFNGLTLKPYYADFFRVVLSRMLLRERILPEDAVGASPEAVKITGPAKDYIFGRSADTMVVKENQSLPSFLVPAPNRGVLLHHKY
ncbi:MAG: transglycosylase domain-containing protein [Parabacteroides sp.]|nr:transglycosylase domain-containing protein [Parabacteroides sp.]